MNSKGFIFILVSVIVIFVSTFIITYKYTMKEQNKIEDDENLQSSENVIIEEDYNDGSNNIITGTDDGMNVLVFSKEYIIGNDTLTYNYYLRQCHGQWCDDPNATIETTHHYYCDLDILINGSHVLSSRILYFDEAKSVEQFLSEKDSIKSIIEERHNVRMKYNVVNVSSEESYFLITIYDLDSEIYGEYEHVIFVINNKGKKITEFTASNFIMIPFKEETCRGSICSPYIKNQCYEGYALYGEDDDYIYIDRNNVYFVNYDGNLYYEKVIIFNENNKFKTDIIKQYSSEELIVGYCT